MRLLCLLILPWFMVNCDIMIAESNETLNEFIKEDYLKAHNRARKRVGVPPLKWDEELAAYAKAWSDKLSEDCRMVHSKGSGFGENIAMTWGSRLYTARQVVKMWVSEKKYYDYDSNECEDGRVCGHYTQVVWRNTKKLGCGYSLCKNMKNYPVAAIYVCEYFLPGNYIGQRPY